MMSIAVVVVLIIVNDRTTLFWNNGDSKKYAAIYTRALIATIL